jgi:hypothetical protein
MRSNLLASVVSAAFVSLIAGGSVLAQDSDELKRKHMNGATLQEQGDTAKPAASQKLKPQAQQGESKAEEGEAAGVPRTARKANDAAADKNEEAAKGVKARMEAADCSADNAADCKTVKPKAKQMGEQAPAKDETVKRKSASTPGTEQAKPAQSATQDESIKKRKLPTAQQGGEGDNADAIKQPKLGQPDSGTSRSKTDIDVVGSVNIDRDKAVRMHDTLVRQGERTNINVSVNIGQRVPERVRLRPLPDEIIEITPQFRGYEYTVVEDEIIIVEPQTKKVVEIIHSKGGKQAARKAHATLKLSARQRDTIREYVTREKVTPSQLDVTMGEDVPAAIALQRFPDTVYEEVPEIQDYEYFIANDGVILVDPGTRQVVEVIQ